MLKRLVMSVLLNRRQREIIWQALGFSAHTYIRRNNPQAAAAVLQVINETEKRFGVSKRYWTKEEVEALIDKSSDLISEKVKRIAEQEYQRGIRDGEHKVHEEIHKARERAEEFAERLRPVEVDFAVEPGFNIDREKCEKCDHHGDCVVFQIVFGQSEADSNDEEEKPKEETAEEGKTEEQPAEGAKKENEGVE